MLPKTNVTRPTVVTPPNWRGDTVVSTARSVTVGGALPGAAAAPPAAADVTFLKRPMENSKGRQRNLGQHPAPCTASSDPQAPNTIVIHKYIHPCPFSDLHFNPNEGPHPLGLKTTTIFIGFSTWLLGSHACSSRPPSTRWQAKCPRRQAVHDTLGS